MTYRQSFVAGLGLLAISQSESGPWIKRLHLQRRGGELLAMVDRAVLAELRESLARVEKELERVQ